MPNSSIPLSEIVALSTTVVASGISAPTYNSGLIIGPTRIVGQSGVPAPILPVTGINAVLSAGYTSTSPEYIAAQLYFDQSPAPQTLYLALQDATAIETGVIDAGGTLYTVGETISVSQTGAQGGTYTVTSVGTGGVVTGITQLAQGTGYSVATNLPTTASGTGSGLTISITAVGQTALQAVQAARAASSNWYGVMVCGAQLADHLAILAYVQTQTPESGTPSFYFGATSDASALAGSAASVFGQAEAANYSRGLLIYSTTQGGVYTQNTYAAAGLMGMALGYFTKLPGSYYTVANKPIVGVIPEPVTVAQLAAIQAVQGNVYISTANGTANVFSDGSLPNGTFFDLTIFTDSFASDLQVAEFNELISLPAIGQVDAQQTYFLRTASTVCQTYVGIGWIVPRTYTGPTVNNLATNTPLPKGYYVQSASYGTQSQANRLARQAMPVLVTATLAGAVQQITIAVQVQQ